MTNELSRARSAFQRATEITDDSAVVEQINSLDEAVLQLMEGDPTVDAEAEKDLSRGGTTVDDDTEYATEDEDHPIAPDVEGDRLEQIEEKVVGLMDETGGRTRDRLEEARDAIDAYRREYARDF